MPAGSPAPSTATTSDSSQSQPLSPTAYNRHPGRKISPTQSKERPISQAIASTLSSLQKHASSSFASGLTSLSAAARSPITPTNDDHDSASADADAVSHDDALIDQLAGLDERLSSTEGIAWTSWDRWRGGSRPALIVAYVTGGLQLYGLEEDGQLVEMINFQQILLPGDRVAGRVLGARIQCLDGKQPRLLVVTEGHDASYVLAVCSLDSPIVDECITLPHVKDATAGMAAAPVAASIQLAHPHLVIGQSHPPALHILDATTLRSREALRNVAAASAGGTPPFHLSGRLLAYASTEPERHSNIIFTPGPESRIETAEQARAAAIEMGTHAGGVARKLGGGLVNGVNNVREWSAQRGAQAATSPPPHQQQRTSHTAASIRVIDLSPSSSASSSSSSSPPLVASWAAEDTAAIKLSSSGSLVFVADSLGHAFNVYEIRPRPSCMRTGSSSSPPVWHRFKLLRGVTPAQVVDVLWSANERCIGVLTGRGSTHVYRLGPLHGPGAKPYGSTLTSFARTAAPAGEQTSPSEQPTAPSPPSPLSTPPVATFAAHVGISAAAGPSLLDVLTFHPRFAVLTLSRIAAREAVVPSTSPSAMSGLTAMIARARTTTQCRTVAIWANLARVHDAPEVRPPGAATAKLTPPTTRRRRSTPARGWVSLAEVHTYDYRQRQPTPLYLTHQMNFKAFAHPPDATLRSEPTLMDISRAATIPREVRETVRITSPDPDGSTRSMQSAMSLAAASSSLPRSPSSPCIPSFPQGQPALGRRRSSKGVAIAAAGMSIPVRQGVAKLGAAAAAAHRRLSSPPVASSPAAAAPALPFDDDVSYDAYLFADARHAQPSPNGGLGAPPTATAMSSLEEEDDAAGTFSSSADTPPTAASDHDDFERDDDGGEWVAARGMQEDVKGDECGWDSFADAEFGIAAPAAGAAKGAPGIRDDFLVGHLTLDDELKPAAKDAMPSFSRKASATATSSPVVGSLQGGGSSSLAGAASGSSATSKLKPAATAVSKVARQKEETAQSSTRAATTASSSLPKSTTTNTASSSSDSSPSSSQQPLTTTKTGFRVPARASPAPFKPAALSLPGSLPTTTTASSSPSSLSSTSSSAAAKRR